MRKVTFEVINKKIETVGDAVEALLTVPKSYAFAHGGDHCFIDIDHYNKCVHMDSVGYINEIVKDTLKDMEKHGEPTEMDIPEEELEPYVPMVYAIIAYGHTNENEATDYVTTVVSLFWTKEAAEQYGDTLVGKGTIDYYRIKPFKILG